MRRVFVALAVFGLAAAAPLLARGDDADIKRQIIDRVRQEKAAGHLHGFELDLKVEAGVVWIQGRVVSPEQEELLLRTAARTPGVVKVMKNIRIGEAVTGEQLAPESIARQSSRRVAHENSNPALAAAPPQRPAVSLMMPPAPPARVVAPLARVESPQGSGSETVEVTPAYPATANAQLVLNPHVVTAPQEPAAKTTESAQQASIAVHVASTPPEISVPPDAPAMKPESMPASPTLLSAIRAAQGQSEEESVLKASANQPAGANPTAPVALQKIGPAQPNLAPVNPYYNYPYAGYYAMPQTPVAFAPAQQASAEAAAADAGAAGLAGGVPAYAPPIHPVSMGTGAGVRYDHPHLPAYAWPSYAAYPNYAAVTYPKQYSPTVWPYIGPFYPYPQVPLGWRKVTLEWDDGWWQLDFKDQRRPWSRD